MLNRVRNWMRLGKKVARKAAGRVPGAIDPQVVRSMDAEQSGWYIEESGQLCDGFQIKPDDIVVDVGTGTGGMAMFAARQGAEVLATDIDEDAIERLNNMAKGQFEGRLRVLVSDSNPLPIPDGFATKVICSEVLEHVPDPAQFLSELARIGQPGAEFLITVPDPVAENIQKSDAPPVYWAPPNHVRIFEPRRHPRSRQIGRIGHRTSRPQQFLLVGLVDPVLVCQTRPQRAGRSASKELVENLVHADFGPRVCSRS